MYYCIVLVVVTSAGVLHIKEEIVQEKVLEILLGIVHTIYYMQVLLFYRVCDRKRECRKKRWHRKVVTCRRMLYSLNQGVYWCTVPSTCISNVWHDSFTLYIPVVIFSEKNSSGHNDTTVCMYMSLKLHIIIYISNPHLSIQEITVMCTF